MPVQDVVVDKFTSVGKRLPSRIATQSVWEKEYADRHVEDITKTERRNEIETIVLT